MLAEQPRRRHDTVTNLNAASIAKAMDAIEDGDITKALSQCKEALAKDPNNPQWLRVAGLGMLAGGQNADAAKLLAKASQFDPTMPGIYRDLGWALFLSGDSQSAAEALGKAAEIDPEDADTAARHGAVLDECGLHLDARSSLENAIRLEPENADFVTALGECLNRVELHDEALERFEEASSLDPQHLGALYGRGVSLAHLGRAGEALPVFQVLLPQASRSADLWYQTGKALYMLEEFEQAKRALGNALRLRTDHGETHLYLAGALTRIGKEHDEDAVASFARASKLLFDDPKTEIPQALAQVRDWDEDELGQWVDRILAAMEGADETP